MTEKSPDDSVGVGMPAYLYLLQFGDQVNAAFGTIPFLVGSAACKKQWRDVDVRLILADEDYQRLIGPCTWPQEVNPTWWAFCLAFSALGQRMTGLPVDFQIQWRTAANEMYRGSRRCALFVPRFEEVKG